MAISLELEIIGRSLDWIVFWYLNHSSASQHVSFPIFIKTSNNIISTSRPM